MKYKIFNILLTILLVVILVVIAYKAFAADTDRSMEYIFNRVFNSTNNTIKII